MDIDGKFIGIMSRSEDGHQHRELWRFQGHTTCEYARCHEPAIWVWRYTHTSTYYTHPICNRHFGDQFKGWRWYSNPDLEAQYMVTHQTPVRLDCGTNTNCGRDDCPAHGGIGDDS